VQLLCKMRSILLGLDLAAKVRAAGRGARQGGRRFAPTEPARVALAATSRNSTGFASLSTFRQPRRVSHEARQGDAGPQDRPHAGPCRCAPQPARRAFAETELAIHLEHAFAEVLWQSTSELAFTEMCWRPYRPNILSRRLSRRAVSGGGSLWGGCELGLAVGRRKARFVVMLVRRLNGGALWPVVEFGDADPRPSPQRSRRKAPNAPGELPPGTACREREDDAAKLDFLDAASKTKFRNREKVTRKSR